VVRGADQGPAWTIAEIQIVLGANFPRRCKKLSGHMDTDAKDYFILPSNRGEKLFPTASLALAQPPVRH